MISALRKALIDSPVLSCVTICTTFSSPRGQHPSTLLTTILLVSKHIQASMLDQGHPVAWLVSRLSANVPDGQFSLGSYREQSATPEMIVLFTRRGTAMSATIRWQRHANVQPAAERSRRLH
jgi:hypothetical protein